MFGVPKSTILPQPDDRRYPPGSIVAIPPAVSTAKLLNRSIVQPIRGSTARRPNRSTAQPLNGPTAQRLNGSTAGFSLLEMIVATTVLSLAIVGLLGLLRASLANAARVREYDRAAMLARSTMTELLATDPLPVPATLSGRYDDKSGWNARTSAAEMPITARTGGVMVAQVKLTVWWNSEGRRKTAVFDGFRRIRIGQEQAGVLP